MRGNKKYRDNFVAAHLSTNTAAQITTMRESRDWTQRELAEKAGMAPARISLIENPSYDKLTLSTLKRLASTFDVALVVRFSPFSELVKWVADLSPEKMNVRNFDADSISIVQMSQKVSKVDMAQASHEYLPSLAQPVNERPALAQVRQPQQAYASNSMSFIKDASYQRVGVTA